MKTLLALLFAALTALAVEPQPGGVRISWNRGPQEVSFGVWQNVNPATNWVLLGTTVATSWVITNAVTTSYNWGVTAIRMSNGIPLPQVDVGVAHWPPSITSGQKTVRITPTGGYSVDTNKWVMVSSDLGKFDDWLKFGIEGNRVRVEHKTSVEKPNAYFEYFTMPPPPLPGGQP